MQSPRRIVVLGCSGSIGKSALDVAAAHPDAIRIVGLSAHRDSVSLLSTAERFSVDRTCLSSDGGQADGIRLRGRLGLKELVRNTDADMVLNAISGYAGLESSIDALETGKDLALANKETMVCAGPLARALAESSGRSILPVDSEHSALFHLIHAHGADSVEEAVVTASGGPFWNRRKEEFSSLTLDDALKHPTWSMGKKITIDSATMANKGLEVIEAHELFGLDYDRIKVLVHRESRVHSMIRCRDGSLYAQISLPDMRLPIQNALLWPACRPSPFGRLELGGETLSFFPPDPERFPLLPLAYEAGRRGGAATLAYNAANEVAVDAFIRGRLSFNGIARTVAEVLDAEWGPSPRSLAEAGEADRNARIAARIAVEGEACP